MQASEGCRKAPAEWRADVEYFKLTRSCRFDHLDLSWDFAEVSNSRNLETQKYFDPFIWGTDPFPDHYHIQQMYGADGFVTRLLFTALQMYVANYIATCSCTDGNISAPAGAHTKTGRCLAAAVTSFGGCGLKRLGLFSLSGFQSTAPVDSDCGCFKLFWRGARLAGMTNLFQPWSLGSPPYESVFL